MRNTAGKLGIARQLANRLFPVTVVIGLLTSLGLPATYYLLQSAALKRTATIRAQHLSERFQDILLEGPSLWKYQTYKYTRLLREVAPEKEVTMVRVLDEAGRLISGYAYETAEAATWWNLDAPVGSAPITFNNRAVGSIQVGVTRGPLVSATLSLLLFSTILGVSLAVCVYTFPVKVVTRLEGRIQELMDTIQRANIELEAKVEDRTRELRISNVQLQETLRRAEEASRAKSEFLANMSHELRTPLNAIIGFSEILQNQSGGHSHEKQARYVGHIHRSGRHLLQLIDGILDFADLESEKLVLSPEPVPVAATLEEVLAIARGRAEKKNQIVEAQIEPDLPPLQADPARFKQILLGLLDNAVKFTQEGGHITVAARRVDSWRGVSVDSAKPVHQSTPLPLDAEGGFLEIRVSDTGIGINPADQPRLFQDFAQLEDPTTKRHAGTGLGLALTKRLVELHGGRIWADSEGEGRGSTFTIALPFTGPRHPLGT